MADGFQPTKFHLSGTDGEALRLDWAAGTEISDADARALHEELAALSGERRLPLLVDGRPVRGLSRGARKEMSQSTLSSKIAVLVDSPLSRTLGNFFLSVERPEVPVRLFGSETEAMAWLRGADT
jgi:hypothetical protein